jgi:hypothetical protein
VKLGKAVHTYEAAKFLGRDRAPGQGFGVGEFLAIVCVLGIFAVVGILWCTL